jgi:hypothetical protein
VAGRQARLSASWLLLLLWRRRVRRLIGRLWRARLLELRRRRVRRLIGRLRRARLLELPRTLLGLLWFRHNGGTRPVNRGLAVGS